MLPSRQTPWPRPLLLHPQALIPRVPRKGLIPGRWSAPQSLAGSREPSFPLEIHQAMTDASPQHAPACSTQRNKTGKRIRRRSAPLTPPHSGSYCVSCLPPPLRGLPPRTGTLRTPPATWATPHSASEEASPPGGQAPATPKSCRPCPKQTGRGKEGSRGLQELVSTRLSQFCSVRAAEEVSGSHLVSRSGQGRLICCTHERLAPSPQLCSGQDPHGPTRASKTRRL